MSDLANKDQSREPVDVNVYVCALKDAIRLLREGKSVDEVNEVIAGLRFLRGLYTYNRLVPCPRMEGGNYYYRGQICVHCELRETGCSCWPSLELPENIQPLRGRLPWATSPSTQQQRKSKKS